MATDSKTKSKHIPNPAATTAPGVYLVTVDREILHTRVRHVDLGESEAEGKRLAHQFKQRVLVLQVVAVYDEREAPAAKAEEEK